MPHTLRSVYELPRGFRACGIEAGIKKAGGLDMAVLVSDFPTTAAGTYTTNQVCAAPVKIDRARTALGKGRAIVVNAGNANACTGEPGYQDALRMAATAAAALGLPEDEVLVCSTGRIGARLPMEKIEAGIAKLAAALAAKPEPATVPLAIMTTDTRPKYITADVPAPGGASVRITACCKGAGMIEPNMATMLCYILTDAAVAAPDLQQLLRDCVHRSFNRVSVDGDTSTNDSVLALANGQSGVTLSPAHPAWADFTAAFDAVCLEMAIQIVKDGEGVTKFITLDVSGARSDADADTAARFVANSYLVKTGWAGTYPVWGRIMDAIGYSPALVDENKVSIDYDNVPVARQGVFAGSPQAAIDAVTKQPAYTIRIDLGLGAGKARLYTCDCTEEYVRINLH